jgi:hypothetical protein
LAALHDTVSRMQEFLPQRTWKRQTLDSATDLRN